MTCDMVIRRDDQVNLSEDHEVNVHHMILGLGLGLGFDSQDSLEG